MIDPSMVDLLACPVCGGAVRQRVEQGAAWLACAACGRRYPIRDGIPVLLADQAEPDATGTRAS